MKRGKLIQTVAYVTPKQKADLEKLSKGTRVSQQAYLREGVDMVLSKYRGKKR
jgi:Ribbon-helix-helix domain